MSDEMDSTTTTTNSNYSFTDSSEEMEYEDSISAESTVRSFSSSGFSDGAGSEGTPSDASFRSSYNIPNEKEETLKHKIERDEHLEPLAKKSVSVYY